MKMKQSDYIKLAEAINKSSLGFNHWIDKVSFVNALCVILVADNKNFNEAKFRESIK